VPILRAAGAGRGQPCGTCQSFFFFLRRAVGRSSLPPRRRPLSWLSLHAPAPTTTTTTTTTIWVESMAYHAHTQSRRDEALTRRCWWTPAGRISLPFVSQKKKRRSKGLKTPRSRSSSATAVERSDWIWRTRRVTTGRGAAIRPRSGTGSRSVLLPVEKAKQAGGDQNQDHHGPAYRRHYCTASLSLPVPGSSLRPAFCRPLCQ
jgi:hypothetical protein